MRVGIIVVVWYRGVIASFGKISGGIIGYNNNNTNVMGCDIKKAEKVLRMIRCMTW